MTGTAPRNRSPPGQTIPPVAPGQGERRGRHDAAGTGPADLAGRVGHTTDGIPPAARRSRPPPTARQRRDRGSYAARSSLGSRRTRPPRLAAGPRSDGEYSLVSGSSTAPSLRLRPKRCECPRAPRRTGGSRRPPRHKRAPPPSTSPPATEPDGRPHRRHGAVGAVVPRASAIQLLPHQRPESLAAADSPPHAVLLPAPRHARPTHASAPTRP